MADTAYTDKVGVTETAARYDESLRLIGKQDESGRTIAISYFSWMSLRMIPLAIRTLAFVFILLLPIIQKPFAWIPAGPGDPVWLRQIESWNLFSWGTWIIAVAIYALYFAISYLKSNIYPGLPGAEIHFEKHKKITRTVRPGELAVMLDPRVKPYAVVSTKPIALEMPEVEGNTRDNISLSFRGALILRVTDTYRLLVQGGFEKFIQQLIKTYESVVKDAIISVDARDFNRFLIEPVTTPAAEKENVSQKLEQLGNQDLTIEFLTDLTEIDEVDVASFDLQESPTPRRRRIIEGLGSLADSYGIEVVDHLPLGNTTSEEYLKSLALPLANSITRLEQSTDTLKEITEEEISEEISANVADKEIGVLEIQKIIKEIESITGTLRDDKNANAIVRAKEVGMENAQQGVLGPRLSAIESLIAQVQARVIDTAGLERYMTESQQVLDWLEAEIDTLVPTIETVMVERLTRDELIPRVDLIAAIMEESGSRAAFDALKRQVDGDADYAAVEREIAALEEKADALNVEESMARIQEALNRITSDSGISTDEYSPEAISRKIDQIAREADLEVGTGESDAPAETTPEPTPAPDSEAPPAEAPEPSL